MLSSFGVLAGLGAVFLFIAKATVMLTAYTRRARRKAEHEKARSEADDVLTLEFGFETQVEQPTLEIVLRAIDRVGLPERPDTLILASRREDYVQAKFDGGGRYLVEARRHRAGQARQYIANRQPAGEHLAIGDVKAIFTEYLTDRSLHADYGWRDITGRH